MALSLVLGPLFVAAPGVPATGAVSSGDAVVRWRPGAIRLQTGRVRLVLSTEGGMIRRTEWVDRTTGADLLAGAPTEDFHLVVDGDRLSSADPGWSVDPPRVQRLPEKALQVEIRARRDDLEVACFRVLYPGLSLMREWMEIRARAEHRIEDPAIAHLAFRMAPATLLWMSGAEAFGDSWRLKQEELRPGVRAFDSYDAPAAPPSPNDGVDLRILLNGQPVWPSAGWAHSAHSNDVVTHDVPLQVATGDRILFVLGRHGHMTCDTTEWDPAIVYEDGERFQASQGFSAEQGRAGWSYGYLGDDGHYEALVYDPQPGRYGQRWRRKPGTIEPFVSETEMHPDPAGCAVRVFTAPRAGQIRVQGSARNTGNQGPAGPGPRLGTQTYAPWFCLQHAGTGQAAYLGFDCIAHWHTDFTAAPEGVEARVRLAGFRKLLRPGEVICTPTAFAGLFRGDLDEMGQELLEWQYRHMWDYTREPWFPGVRLLGYWYKGTSWPTPFACPTNDPEAAFRKAFRIANLMREVGGDTYHRDWGWWDRPGDWNGPDFRAVNDYLRQHGMGLLMYAYIYNVDPASAVARAHPEWLIAGTVLDQSRSDVVDYEADLLSEFYDRWGPYQFRNDALVIAPKEGDDTSLLAQQQGFFTVIRRFLDRHPDCAMHGVNGGGFALNWEYLRYTSGFQFTDGQAQAIANYYASYLFPPDKINNMPDIWDPERFDPATWRGLLCANIDFTGDTFDPSKLEGIRQIIDIYHYLQARGVVGRWVRVYHPRIEGDDPTMYLQRLSWDRKRGVVITKHRIQGAVTIYPKGLLPDLTYRVDFQDSREHWEATGAQLMREGIALTDPAPGELIYLNLPDHPGNTLDQVPPRAPTRVVAQEARHMGVPGVEVRWRAARDDHWLSYYEVYRDAEMVGRVAKGCFFFDHSAGADPAARYRVRAVDGSGNRSRLAAARPAPGPRRLVLDDSESSAIEWSGDWERQTSVVPAHHGTLSVARAAGSGFALRFQGRRVVWHSWLGARGGLARVQVDDEAPVTVSCFAADEIPAWPLFERAWETPGDHVLRVEVLGQPDSRGKETCVWVDGIAIVP